MIRNGRTPTILLVALVIIILIISYNNWSLSQRSISLRDSLIVKDEKLNDLIEKKAYVEKQIGINSDRIKYLEERIEVNKQVAKQKDSDIDDLNSKLRIKTSDIEKLALELNEAKEALNLCKLEKNKEIELAKKQEVSSYLEEIKKLTNQLNNTKCDSGSIDNFKKKFNNLVKSQFTETEYLKILSLADSALNDSPNEKIGRIESDKLDESTTDVCKLLKETGDCDQKIDRYYYDAVSERCLVFPYSGCKGNQNNFKTLEDCEKKCSSNKIVDTQINEQNQIINTTTQILQTVKSTSSTRSVNLQDLNK